MTDRVRYRPFTGDSTTRIRLKAAPLALVLCQVRWPEMTSLQGDLKPAALELGAQLDDYPIYGEMREVGYTITPDGIQPTAGGMIYQWQSIDARWHVSFARRFVSFFCTEYGDYDEFSTRLSAVITAIAGTIRVPLVERVGIRYVNQISDRRIVDDLDSYVRPEVLGYSALRPQSQEARLVGSANQARYEVGELALQVRTGVIPRGETVDPSVKPLEVESWVMDLDASAEQVAPFDADSILAQAGRLSDVAYDYFKLVTTEGFVREFGGEV